MNEFNADLTHIHPARDMPFDFLCAELERVVKAGLVRRTDRDGASLYCYTKDCVYNRAWSEITKLCRGLIIDHGARKILATPFPKFFNIGEGDHTGAVPSGPFETFEKMDGSLIIIYWHAGRWRAATKGSLDSEQAWWAQLKLDALLRAGKLMHLYPGCTYLCEGIYNDNRIVIRYPFEGLVLLGAYTEEGREIAYRNLALIADDIGWRMAKRFNHDNLAELMIATKALPVTEEGYVLRFPNGDRWKLKGDEYSRVHRLISGCTPLALWEAMMHGQDLRAMRRSLPEEFWGDFDKIVATIGVQFATLVNQIDTACASIAWDADVDNKELGLTLKKRFAEPWRNFVFHRHKGRPLMPPMDWSKADPVPPIRRSLFGAIRPTRNRLMGYEPSRVVNRVQEEL